jgi:hypothetical protein
LGLMTLKFFDILLINSSYNSSSAINGVRDVDFMI